jgi:hypothetical protein
MKGNKVRGTLAGSAVVALLAAISDFKTWQDFLLYIASTAGGAVVLWAVIEVADNLYHKATKEQQWLPYNLKYYGALVLAFVIPLGSNAILLYTGAVHWSYLTVAAIIAGVYQLAQTIHWEQDETQEGKAVLATLDEGGKGTP